MATIREFFETKLFGDSSGSDKGKETNCENSPIISDNQEPRPESEKIKQWKIQQTKRLEKKALEEEKKRKEWMETAKVELDNWHKQHSESLIKVRDCNRNAEEPFEEIMESQNEEIRQDWDKICSYCQFDPNHLETTTMKDTSRMRSVLLHLKKKCAIDELCEEDAL